MRASESESESESERNRRDKTHLTPPPAPAAPLSPAIFKTPDPLIEYRRLSSSRSVSIIVCAAT